MKEASDGLLITCPSNRHSLTERRERGFRPEPYLRPLSPLELTSRPMSRADIVRPAKKLSVIGTRTRFANEMNYHLPQREDL